MVEHVLAKDETGVRFSLPAQRDVFTFMSRENRRPELRVSRDEEAARRGREYLVLRSVNKVKYKQHLVTRDRFSLPAQKQKNPARLDFFAYIQNSCIKYTGYGPYTERRYRHA